MKFANDHLEKQLQANVSNNLYIPSPVLQAVYTLLGGETPDAVTVSGRRSNAGIKFMVVAINSGTLVHVSASSDNVNWQEQPPTTLFAVQRPLSEVTYVQVTRIQSLRQDYVDERGDWLPSWRIHFRTGEPLDLPSGGEAVMRRSQSVIELVQRALRAHPAV